MAGLAYMMTGPIVGHAHHTNIVVGTAWLPALMALIELGFRRRSALPLFLFVPAVAFLVLGAQPQYTLYCALACGVFFLWRLRLIAAEVKAGRAGIGQVAWPAAGFLFGGRRGCSPSRSAWHSVPCRYSPLRNWPASPAAKSSPSR